MSVLKEINRLYSENGLILPLIPKPLCDHIEQQGQWLFSTRKISMSPYNFEYFITEENSEISKEYCILSHSGHGANSWALHYYLIHDGLEIFIQKSWGGIYSNITKNTKSYNSTLSLVNRIIEHPGLNKVPIRLAISDFDINSSIILLHKKKISVSKDVSPEEALTEVITSLNRSKHQSPDIQSSIMHRQESLFSNIENMELNDE